MTEMRTQYANMFCHCGRPATMHVGKVGYCSVHRAEAQKANKIDASHRRAAAMVNYRMGK
jgi:hypothetical protein